MLVWTSVREVSLVGLAVDLQRKAADSEEFAAFHLCFRSKFICQVTQLFGGSTLSYVSTPTALSNSGTRLSADFVPESFDELFSHYYVYVVKLVQSFGIDRQNAEDVAMTILTTFFEKDALSDFNPEYTTAHSGIVRKAVFRTFLSGFVSIYVRHYRDRQNLSLKREGISTDSTLFTNYETGEPVTWMDYCGPRFYEEFEDHAEEDLINQIRARVAAAKPRNAQDKCDLVLFFELVLQQTKEHGEVQVDELATLFDVSKTSIQNWLKRLRVEVNSVVEEQ